MGNCLACRRMKKERGANTGAVITKNHNKVVERAKGMLMDWCGNGCLRLQCKLKFGHVDDNHDRLSITIPPASPDPDPLLIAPRGGKRIKLILTQRELQELLSSNVSGSVEDMVFGMITEKGTPTLNTAAASGWKPVLQPIPEGSEVSTYI